MRSPSGTSSPATGSTDFSTGVLSPVSAASSISSVAARIRRPSAGTLSPASKVTMSPGTTSSAGMSTRCAAAADMRVDQEHLLERGDALGGLALLVEAQDRVQHGQADDHETGRPLLQRDDADDRGAEEDELHQVAVLAEERLPARLLLRLGELVRADLRPAPLDLGGVQPGPRVDAELRGGVVRGQAVPVRVAAALRARLLNRGGAHSSLRPDDDDLRAVRADLVAAVVLGAAGVRRQTDHARAPPRARPPIVETVTHHDLLLGRQTSSRPHDSAAPTPRTTMQRTLSIARSGHTQRR